MKLKQFIGPYTKGQTIMSSNLNETIENKVIISMQIPFGNLLRYIEEDFYENDIVLDNSSTIKNQSSFSYLELENNKIKTPHWMEKQNDFNNIKSIKSCAPFNVNDISITIDGEEKNFEIGENNILEFDLGDGLNNEWIITAQRDLPYGTIIDILYE